MFAFDMQFAYGASAFVGASLIEYCGLQSCANNETKEKIKISVKKTYRFIAKGFDGLHKIAFEKLKNHKDMRDYSCNFLWGSIYGIEFLRKYFVFTSDD